MRAAVAPGSPLSVSISLVDFDHELESPLEGPEHCPESQPNLISTSAPRSTAPLAVIANPFEPPVQREDLATQSDITSIRELIQREFELLRTQLPAAGVPPNPPPFVAVPAEAFTDALRAELAVQIAKISVLEEETRKLRAEKQELRAALDRAENEPTLLAELGTANQELKRVYVERRDLWEERANLWKEREDLWRERQSLWDERGVLWQERGELWTLRDELSGRVKSLEAKLGC
ncbi:hypothetical protein CTheo_7282 [Ceratobasidium theobromae]|uniref:Uncharacterized protein n=1 Tax=Ceratobasidium theobromae TaxID=1582974 RepID=A0A5N5QC11_9AGAM|nr:hypothetical protein CTheo_7282 [Ceratobasidium theobromae]